VNEWHVITGEYPPQPGGVSDYTRIVASGLAAAGDVVHIWCPRSQGPHPEDPGVFIHRELGAMRPHDLLRAGRMLDKFSKPRRILVQWVPHAFGFRSANLPLSFWIWSRAFSRGDRVEVMIHEPYLPMPQHRLRHTALAIVHRMMLAAVLRAASRVWVAIPKWEEYCRPYTFGRRVSFAWLPVISNIPAHPDNVGGQAVRTRYLSGRGVLIGHFGTCGGAIGDMLRAVIPDLLDNHPERAVLLIGQDGQHLRGQLLEQHPQFYDRIHSTGSLSSREVSLQISACDLMLQPYPDGASTRRGGLMAALSHGKPIVTTSGRLTEAFWQESGAVVLASAGNHAEIIDSVGDLLADQCKRERLAAAAKITYARHFDLFKTVSMLQNGPFGGQTLS
jgi:Glycosyl transferases group 1